MKSLRVLLVLVTSISLCVPTSACCLFPWLAPYTGCGYGFGMYPPAYSGYSSGYGGNCCGYVPSSSCCSPCSSCSGGSCGGSCGATEVRKEPVEDPISKEKQDSNDTDRSRPRTFEGSDYDRDRADDSPGKATDDFGGQGDAGRWSPGGSDRNGSRGSGDDSMLDRIPGADGFGGSSRKPPADSFGQETPEFNDLPPADTENRESRKPEIRLPVDEAAGAGADTSTDGETGTEKKSDSTESGAANDFLSPDQTSWRGHRERLLSAGRFRSRLSEVVAPGHRLAATGERVQAARQAHESRLSDAHRRDLPVRWISVPAPAGRIRL